METDEEYDSSEESGNEDPMAEEKVKLIYKFLYEYWEVNSRGRDISYVNAVSLNRMSFIVAEFAETLGFVSNTFIQFHEDKLLRDQVMSADLAHLISDKIIGIVAMLEKNTKAVRKKLEEYLIEWEKLLENSL